MHSLVVHLVIFAGGMSLGDIEIGIRQLEVHELVPSHWMFSQAQGALIKVCSVKYLFYFG